MHKKADFEDDEFVLDGDGEGYNVSMAYEIVTEESAEIGDAEERGYEIEDRFCETIDDVISIGNDKAWIAWSSDPMDPSHDWLISQEEKDMYDGSSTSYTLRIKREDGKPLSPEEVQALENGLRVSNKSNRHNRNNVMSKENGIIKVNSNSFVVKSGSVEYKEIESILSKVAADNKIDGVEEIELSLSKEAGVVKFKVSTAVSEEENEVTE
jgi:hypothetical protein